MDLECVLNVENNVSSSNKNQDVLVSHLFRGLLNSVSSKKKARRKCFRFHNPASV